MSSGIVDDLEMDISCCCRYDMIKYLIFIGLYASSQILKLFNDYLNVFVKMYLKHLIKAFTRKQLIRPSHKQRNTMAVK